MHVGEKCFVQGFLAATSFFDVVEAHDYGFNEVSSDVEHLAQ